MVKKAILSTLLAREDNMAKAMETAALEQSAELDMPQVSLDSIEFPSVVFRIDHIYRSHSAIVNELLSSPVVYRSILALAGNDVIPLGVDILYKSSYDASAVPWHQGSIHNGSVPCFAMSV
ncbi:hypothetical protein [Planctobacterium marinum]|uniref:Uncharacterized protein n=1 Tax=Planctobacterium marinum TaxID=1631968 RepID=A0AA48KSK2_9ALTE|nr:hypothetical protein MACH26_42090 [Planctobacterium marinum]